MEAQHYYVSSKISQSAFHHLIQMIYGSLGALELTHLLDSPPHHHPTVALIQEGGTLIESQ